MSYRSYDTVTTSSSAISRVAFIRKTYAHLAGAIAFFVVLSAALSSAGVGESILSWMGQSRMGWLLILGGFMVAGYLAQSLARSKRSIGVQYAGLGLYAAAEAIIFSPMLFIASKAAPGVLPEAAIITLAAFAGLTGFVMFSKTDFSFMGAGLAMAGFIAFGAIICGAIFGFSLGIWFSVGMLLFAGAAVIYSTSNVMRVYPTDQYVAAALDLFAAIAILFWYVLRILLELNRR